MKKTTIKPSEIATVCAWGGVKKFIFGPAEFTFYARTESDNKYTISCRLSLNDVNKELFSCSFELTPEEFEAADKRFPIEYLLLSEDLDSIVADRVVHDVFGYFVLQAGIPIAKLTEFKDEEHMNIWGRTIHELIHKRMTGEPLI